MISDEMLGNVLTQVARNMILDRRRASRKQASFWDEIDHPKKLEAFFFGYVFLDGYGMPNGETLSRKDANLTFLDNVKKRPYLFFCSISAQNGQGCTPFHYH